MEKVFITLERFKSLRLEIKNLKTNERKQIADKLSQFRDSVDLVEDTIYNDILQEQVDLEVKIEEIENLLENAYIIKKSRSVKANVGSTVVIRKIGDRKKLSLKIVGSIDANPSTHSVSNESPLGKAILGKKKDEVIEINTPTGIIKYKILEVK